MRSIVMIFLLLPVWTSAQFKRYTYHDAEKKVIKEVYQVKDTIQNILHGRYVSYFLNGNLESKGQFVNNETSGVWEFYYETGNLKCGVFSGKIPTMGCGNIFMRMARRVWRALSIIACAKGCGKFIMKAVI